VVLKITPSFSTDVQQGNLRARKFWTVFLKSVNVGLTEEQINEKEDLQ